MAKVKVIAFTEFRYENKEYIPINLTFVNKDFDTVDFTDIICHRKFYSAKEYIDCILDIAMNNNFAIDWHSRFEAKWYDIMFRDMNDDTYKYDRFAYYEV